MRGRSLLALALLSGIALAGSATPLAPLRPERGSKDDPLRAHRKENRQAGPPRFTRGPGQKRRKR